MNDNTSKKSKSQRRAILQKAGTLFWENGYDSTSMRDIARVCKFEVSNIYNYFPSKEQLLYEVIKEEIGRTVYAVKHLEHDNATGPVEKLRFLIYNHFELVTGHRRSFRLIFDTELRNLSTAHRKEIIRLRDDYDRILRKIISEGVATGDFANTDEQIVGFAIASMIIRSRIWFAPKGRLAPKEIAEIMFNFALKGLKGNSQK